MLKLLSQPSAKFLPLAKECLGLNRQLHNFIQQKHLFQDYFYLLFHGWEHFGSTKIWLISVGEQLEKREKLENKKDK